jgi:2-hydroxychromene-2-carboxylate isomerase
MRAEPKKMDDTAVFRNILTAAQFDAVAIFRFIEMRIEDELLHNTERSVERGTFGSPTFYVGDEIFFGKDRLRRNDRVDADLIRLF